MNRKKIIVIVVAVVLVLVILAKSKKTDGDDTTGTNTGGSSSGNSTGGASTSSTQKSITDSDLNYVIGEFYEIFDSGTYDRERAQAVSLFREYIHSKADLKALMQRFDSYHKTKFKQSFEQLVYSKIYGHGTYFEQLNQALKNNGVDYQF